MIGALQNPAFGHRCMNDLKTESGFDSQATRHMYELRLFSRHVICGCLHK